MGKQRKRRPVCPPPACLERAAPHVKHDVCLLQAAYQEGQTGATAYIAWYSLCRSAIAFFEGTQPPRYPDDIMAVQYFEDAAEWEQAKAGAGVAPDEYLAAREWTNVLAAHLSFARIGYEGRYDVAPSPEVTEHVRKLYEAFLGALTSERRAWFDRAEDPRDRR